MWAKGGIIIYVEEVYSLFCNRAVTPIVIPYIHFTPLRMSVKKVVAQATDGKSIFFDGKIRWL